MEEKKERPREWALVIEHADTPGELARVTSILAGWDISISGIAVRRNQRTKRAVTFTLVDSKLPDEAIDELRARGKQEEAQLRPEFWKWNESGSEEELDLDAYPQGWSTNGTAIVKAVPDRPGQIAKVARVLSQFHQHKNQLRCAGFVVYRAAEPAYGLLATLMDCKAEDPALKDDGALLDDLRSVLGPDLVYECVSLKGLGEPLG